MSITSALAGRAASATSLAAQPGSSWCHPHRGDEAPTATDHDEDGHEHIATLIARRRNRISGPGDEVVTADGLTISASVHGESRSIAQEPPARRYRIRSWRPSGASSQNSTIVGTTRKPPQRAG